MDTFFTELTVLFEQICERHFNTDNLILVQSLSVRAQECLDVMRPLYVRIENLVLAQVCPPNRVEGTALLDIGLVICHLQQYVFHFNELLSQMGSCLVGADQHEHVPEVVRCLGECGRPAFMISQDQMEGLLELGFSFTRIAEIIGVSERTIRRQRIMFGLPVGADRYSIAR